MQIKNMTKRLLSLLLIMAMVLLSMTSSMPKLVQAAVNQEKLTSADAQQVNLSNSSWMNASEKYLYLGGQGAKSYNFNIKKEAMVKGATYVWYVKADKGNPDAVKINKKTGIVTAKEAGTAYIRCKVTLTDGTVFRPEAKVTVRNNITKVKINNLPANLTIAAGIATDFNRTILDTDAGKGVKTLGITRFEIKEDTADVEAATTQGIVFPVKEGEFKIRAVCFQSMAKYKLWLADKNATRITAASEWAVIKVTSANGLATASTQEQLNKLLQADNITQITLSTEKAVTFVIPEGDYSSKNLIVNAANADVENHGIFKDITINAIKDTTWIEYANGNIVYLKDDAAGFVIDKDVDVKRIVIDKADSKLNIEINGTVEQIIVLQPSELNITGSGKQVPVSVEQTAGGSTITSTMPLNLELKAKTDLRLNQGAEETVINKSVSEVIVKIENNTKKDSTITTNKGGGEAIESGQTVISGGTGTAANPSTGPSTGTSAITVNGITVTSAGAAVAVAYDGTLQMSTVIAPANATNQTIAWTVASLVGGTATIDANGLLTATGIGTVQVTATNAASGVAATKELTITAKQLTIAAPTIELSKTYDGTTLTVVTAGALTGVVTGDTVTVSTVATYDTAAVGAGKTITVVYTLGGTDAGKYTKPADTVVTNGIITAKQLTIGAPTVTSSKEYDKKTTAVVAAGALTGVAVGDTVTVSAVATYDTAAVGSGKTITVVYALGGADAGKYTKPADTVVTNGIITAKQLTIGAPTVTSSKDYDGTTLAVVAAGALTGVEAGDTVTVSAVATYDTAAVGSWKSITVVYTLGGADAGKYTKPADTVVTNGIITAKQLTIGAPTVTSSKAYDGTTLTVVTAGALTGVAVGDTVTVSAVATYDTAAVGSGKTITVVYTLGGADAGKYTKPADTVVTNGIITAKQLTIGAPTVTSSKAYDGTTLAVVAAGALTGVAVGDTVTVSTVATYDTAAVGSGKTITVVYTLGGADAGKYTKPADTVVTNGIITAKQLTIGAPTVTSSKAYDGTTLAVVAAGALTGVAVGDTVTVSTVATYDTAAVGSGKTITVVYTLGGADAGKYTKPTDTVVTNGIITAKQLTIGAPTVTSSKAYDGTTTAVVVAGTLTGVAAGDTVTVSTVATYNTAAVGSGKTITVVYTLGGADAGKYTKPTDTVVTNGIITAKQLTIGAPTVTSSKAYDGTTTAVVVAGTLTGVAAGDTVTVSAVAIYDTAAIESGKTITVAYTLGGANAANYTKPADTTVTSGVISAKQLSVGLWSLTSSKVYDGTTTAVVTAGTLGGVVAGDTVTISAVATYDTAAVGTGKTITIVYTLGGTDAGKYTKPADTTVTSGVISAKQLSVGLWSLTSSKVYDGTTTAVVTAGTLGGVVAGDTVTISAVATYDTAAVGTGKTITIVYTLGGTDAGNYIKPGSGSVTYGVITGIPLAFSSIVANGTPGSVTTTQLILSFDLEPTSLTAGDITVEGATKGSLTGTGLTRTLTISNITVEDGATITVSITNPAGFAITPSSKTVAINLSAVEGDLLKAWKSLNAIATINPIKEIDGNVNSMAQAIVDNTVAGVTVSVGFTGNPNVANDGSITYNLQQEQGNVIFNLTKGGITISKLMDVLVPATTPLVIGDNYGGGKVFYILAEGDPGYDADVQHGLIVSTANQSTNTPWAKAAFLTTAVTGTELTLGSGLANTLKIIAQNGVGIDYAAGLAHAYNGGGSLSWYLPSKEELDKLFLNRAAIGTVTYVYYSSTEKDVTHAFKVDFVISGYYFSVEKSSVSGQHVRAIRSF